MNWLSEVEKQQSELLKVINNFSSSPGRVPEEYTAMYCLLNQNERHNIAALGSAFYHKFVGFTHNIDSQHPDLLNIFDGELVNNKPNSFCQVFHATSKIAHQCESWGFGKEFANNLKMLVQKHKMWKHISRSCDDPRNNHQFIRLMPSAVVRANARQNKKPQEINLNLLLKRGVKYWSSLPSAFTSFHRFQSRTSKEVLAAKKKLDHFKKFGLQEMANVINQSITKLEFGYNKQMYYGFNRVTHTQVAGILAKMLGCQFDGEQITISNKEFNHPLVDSKEPTTLKYRAKLYPWHTVCSHVPVAAKVNNVIKLAESFPEFNSKAAFDHYYVIVPSFEHPLPKLSGSIYYCTDPETKKQMAFGSVEDLYREFDFRLLRQQKLPGIVLGERDGASYFLCYWI